MTVAEITRMLGLELEENSDYVDWVHLCTRASGFSSNGSAVLPGLGLVFNSEHPTRKWGAWVTYEA